MSTFVIIEVKQQWAMSVLGWVPECTTHISDGFAAHASRLKPLSALSVMQVDIAKISQRQFWIHYSDSDHV